MFANSILTIVLAIVTAVLVLDFIAFFSDRSHWGNLLVAGAIIFVAQWFLIGLVNAWK